VQHVVLAGERRFDGLSVNVIPAACAGCAFGSFLAVHIITSQLSRQITGSDKKIERNISSVGIRKHEKILLGNKSRTFQILC